MELRKWPVGFICIEQNMGGHYLMYDHQTWEKERRGLLETVFEDGELKPNSNL